MESRLRSAGGLGGNMKLLSILPSRLRGGAEEYALTIASAARRYGWKVYAAFPQIPGTASLIQDFRLQGIDYHPVNVLGIADHGFRLFREHIPPFLRTISLLVKLKPNVVHITLPWPHFGFASILACALLKIPTVVVVQLIPYQVSFTRRRLRAYAWARSRSQQWIAVSDNNRQFVSGSFRIPLEQVRLIYNGTRIKSDVISLTPDEVAELRGKIREQLGLPRTSKVLITVGRLAETKGYLELVQIVPPIMREFSDVSFVWVGDGELKEFLIRRIADYGLEDKVLLLGYRSDVPRLLKGADLFVFPTHFEGLPFSVLEAIAHGVPIVTSDASSLPEIIENKVQGLFFRNRNSQSLLETLRHALKHPEEMAEMAHHAQSALENFSEEKMIRETFEVLRKLAHLGGSGQTDTNIL